MRESYSKSCAYVACLQIREIEAENVDMVGGSVRKENGQWNLNCYQFLTKNYSLKVVPGYHVSTKESCLVCDLIQGPFLARTEIFQRLQFESVLDFFLQAKVEAKLTLLNCPDIMSNVILPEKISKVQSLPIAQKYEFYHLQLWNGQKFEFDSKDLNTSCEKYPGEILSPVCIQVQLCSTEQSH